MANTPKINVRNNVSECTQSPRKESASKYHYDGIKDCIAFIATPKINKACGTKQTLLGSIGIALTSHIAVYRPSEH